MPKCPTCKTHFAEDEGPVCDCDRQTECPDCTETFDPDLFPKIRGCFDHEDDREELREMAFNLNEKVKGLKERVRELESRCKYKEGYIQELELELESYTHRRLP